MPFSKENRRFTVSMIAIVVIAVAGLAGFVWLAHTDWERTYLYGTVTATLIPVLCLQVLNLQKTGRVAETVQEGQQRAEQRTESVKSELNTIKETVEQAEGMPRTPDELRAFIRVETPFIIRQTIAELREQGMLTPTEPKP